MRKFIAAICAAAFLSAAPTPALADGHAGNGANKKGAQKCKTPKFIEVTTNRRDKLLLTTANIIQVHPSTSDVRASDVRIVIKLGSTHHTVAADQSYQSVVKALCGVAIQQR